MRHVTRYIIISLVGCVIALGAGAGVANATVLSPTPSSQTVSLGETVIVDVIVHSEQEQINTVAGSLRFPSDLLEPMVLEDGASFLTLWPEEPHVTNTGDAVVFAGGIPNGTYAFDAKAFSVTFRARAAGVATLSFDPLTTTVLRNDGLGTPTTIRLESATLTIGDPVPGDVLLLSPTHPDEDVWYATQIFTVTWPVTEGAFYSYILSGTPNGEPDDVPEEAVGSVTFDDLADGVHTFLLRQRLTDDTWTNAGSRRVKVDTAPPLPFEIVVSRDAATYGGRAVASFVTTDAMSGIARYDVTEGTQTTRDAASPYILRDQTRGTAVTVTAYDAAGNVTSARLAPTTPNQSSSVPTQLILVTVTLLFVCFVIVLVIRSRRSRHDS